MDFRGVGGIPHQVSPRTEKSTSSPSTSASNEPKLMEEMARPIKRANIGISAQRAAPKPEPSPLQLPTLPPLPPSPISAPQTKTQIAMDPKQLPESKTPSAKKVLADGAKLKAWEALYAATGKSVTSTHHQATPEIIRQTAMGVIEVQAKGKQVTPEHCISLAKQLKPLQDKDSAITTTMHRLYDTAAEIYENANNPVQAFKTHREAFEACKFSKDHSLNKMTEAITTHSKTLYGQGGLQLPSGSSHVVGTVVLQTRPHPDNKPRDVLTYEVSSAGREAFESRLGMIQGNLEAFNKSLPKELGNVSIKISPNSSQPQAKFFLGRDENENFSLDRKKGFPLPPGATFHEIEFTSKEGKPIGQVTLGNSKDFESLYTSVRVEVLSHQDKGQGLKTMQGILTVLGLGPVLGAPVEEDKGRIKMGLIAEAYFPKVWAELQQDKSFYQLSERDIEHKIIAMLPDDQKAESIEIFNRYRTNPSLIGNIEILPGNERMTLNDLSTQMQAKGYIGCMAGVSNSQSAASICELGFLSTEYRHRSGIVKLGESSMSDITTGGSRSVFVRAVNNEVIKTPFPEKKWKKQEDPTAEKVFDEYDVPDDTWKFSGKYQFIIAPEVVNGGGYGYYGDFYGVKGSSHEDYPVYQNRDNLINFSEKLGVAKDNHSTKPGIVLNDKGVPINPDGSLQKDPLKGTLNEVAIPGGILPPQHFLGINCINNEAKLALTREFQRKGLLVDPKIENGKVVDYTLLLGGGSRGVSLNEFLHVGNQLKKHMWET